MFSRGELHKRVATLIRRVGTLIANGFVYPLSKLIPRRADLWLFGHQDGAFAGNSKALFLWVVTNRPDVRAVWITSDRQVRRMLEGRGLPVAAKPGVAATWLAARAGAYFYCHGPADISVALSRGALLVNLWHGVGLKSLAWGNPTTVESIYRSSGWIDSSLKLSLRIMPDVLVTTSEAMQQHFASQFQLPLERCPPLGYPRLDLARDRRLAELIRQLPGGDPRELWPEGVEEVYAYVPTYRDSRGVFAREAIPRLDKLEDILRSRNAVLYIKPHRHTAGEWVTGERVRLWPKVDLDAALPHLTGLITDYSSVHYDYIFHRSMGSILYLFDEEEYLSADRLLLYPLRENTAGWIASSFEELLHLIASGAALQEHARLAEVREKFWGRTQAPASPRIAAYVDELLNQRRRLVRSVRAPTAVRSPR
jgi:CDP-glycerol glycerophosphotransferase (TagB/SpsB family)